jgi:GNAT superfamily N-acetyltransferase
MGETLALRRELVPDDPKNVACLVAATGFFSATEVAIAAELVTEGLARGTASGYEFLLAEDGGQLLGYTCFGPIAGTRASFDLYWIVVDPRRQNQGIGRELLARTEALIAQAGGQRVYIETSSREQYAPTRAFYARCGYRAEAVLEDFYAPGDGKAIYVKALG